MDIFGFQYGYDQLSANETIKGSWFCIEALNGDVTLSSIKAFRNSDKITNLTLKEGQFTYGPMKEVTKSSGNGFLKLYRTNNYNK